MAKPLKLCVRGEELSFHLKKVDREAIYGSIEMEALDGQGRRCEMMLLADDGRTLVGKGCTAFAKLSPDGDWCEKSQLRPVTLDGGGIDIIPSSFEAPVSAVERVTVEDYLSHVVKSVYTLEREPDTMASASELLGEVASGAIYSFPFNYRAGLEADAAFLLANPEGDIFLTVARARQMLRPKGYFGYLHCGEIKGYAGVAIYTRRQPDNVQMGLGIGDLDKEGRYVQVDFGALSIASLYLPSGSNPPRLAAKFLFMREFYLLLERLRAGGREPVICGDWNIAHKEIDLKNWRSNRNHPGFLPEERAWLTGVFDELNYVDVFRRLNRSPDQYTWWSNRGDAWAKNVVSTTRSRLRGWRERPGPSPSTGANVSHSTVPGDKSVGGVGCRREQAA